MKVLPMGDRVAVEPDGASEKTEGGIVIPQSARKVGSQTGTVKAVGRGTWSRDGSRLIEPMVKVGDRVAYEKYKGTEIIEEGVTLLLMPESTIVAVLED